MLLKFCSVWLLMSLGVVCAAERISFSSGAHSNNTSSQSVIIDWGNPKNIDSNGEYKVSALLPEWLVAVRQAGGGWITNIPAWHVAAESEENAGILSVVLDRSLISCDPVVNFRLFDFRESTLYLDLRDANDEIVASNLFGNLLCGSSSIINTNMTIPLMDYTNAVAIDLRRGWGEIIVFDTSISLGDLKSKDTSGAGSTLFSMSKEGSSPSNERPVMDAVSSKADKDRGNGDAEDEGRSSGGLMSGTVIYVDRVIGDDGFSGLSRTKSKDHGPKKTVNGALKVAKQGSVVSVNEGIYHEKVRLFGVKLITSGKVIIREYDKQI